MQQVKKWFIALSAFAVMAVGTSGKASAANQGQPKVEQKRDLMDYFAEDSLEDDLADFNQADILRGISKMASFR